MSISKYNPEYCKLLVEWMSEGYNFKSFSTVVKVSVTTLNKWVTDYEEFKLAKEIGEQEYSKIYQNNLRGLSKHNVKACTFALTNVDPDSFKEKVTTEVNGNVQYKIVSNIKRDIEAVEAEYREIEEEESVPSDEEIKQLL